MPLDEADTQPDSAGPMPTRSRERQGPFCLQGRRTEGVAWATACPTAVYRRRVKRARYWGVRNYAEAAALGIPEFGHTGPPGLPGGRADQGSSCPGAQTPRTRTALSCRRSTACPGWKSRRPGERRTTASAPAEAGTPRPDESPGRPAGPPSGRSPAGYGPAASGTYAPTHLATGISASCERPPPGPGSPEATRILRS
jgi:hypothetical protein